MAPRKPAEPKPTIEEMVDTAEADGDQVTPETPEEAARRIFDTDLTKRPVVAKLARIMADLPSMEPGGKNQHFGYKYITDKQVNSVIRPRMARERLMVIPDAVEESWVETKTAKGGTSWVTKVKINFTVVDADSGDEISGHGFGYGDDSGDKGANKAFTAAMKYWLLKLFQMGGEDDLEDDARADQRASQRETGQGPANQNVSVQGAKIEGIQRGGRSVKVTGTQNRQIAALVKAMDMTPEVFVDFLKGIGKTLVVPEQGDATPAIHQYLISQTADDAGTLIATLVAEQDRRNTPADDGIPEEEPGGDYPN